MKITASLKGSLCLLFATLRASPLFGAEKQLKAVGLPVADLSNPFFVQTILIPVKLITRENVNEYQGWTK